MPVRYVVCAFALTVAVAGLTGCSSDSAPAREASPASPRATIPSASSSPTLSPTPPATPARPAGPDHVRITTAMAAVRQLAGRIGPRPGTSPAFFRAAAWVERGFTARGWQVRRQSFRAPGGVSWGIPVPAGRSVNLVATRGDVRSGKPWLLVGAHLDTVPQAPGAEDNASGIGVLLALAEALEDARTRTPVALVAFGSEEPRGPGDDDHHFGSRAFIDQLDRADRGSLRGMVSLDRVGVGGTLPVSSAQGPDSMRSQLLAAAQRAGVETQALTGDRASDHWSFVRAGLPGARLGSTPYAGYHSPDDVPSVVDPAQLRRTARTVIAWLAP